MNDEPIRCPKCHSTQIHIAKRGFKMGRAITGGMITGNVLSAIIAGGIGMNNIELTCLKCGNKFKAGDAYSTTSATHDRKVHEFEQHVAKEREQTAMYKCVCGKESCLPVSAAICPKCGRKLNDNNKFTPKYERNGCMGVVALLIIAASIWAFV